MREFLERKNSIDHHVMTDIGGITTLVIIRNIVYPSAHFRRKSCPKIGACANNAECGPAGRHEVLGLATI